jgi:hypothetical protein
MWLVTDEANTAAQALYRAAGGEPSRHDDAAFWWQLDRVRRDVPIGERRP